MTRTVNLVVHESQLQVSGGLQTYVETGDDDDGEYVNRKFCGTCGSPIVSELVQTEGVVAVQAGSRDEHPDAGLAQDVLELVAAVRRVDVHEHCPTLAVAYGRSTHSAQFGDQMPTHEGLDGTAAEQIADVVLGWGG